MIYNSSFLNKELKQGYVEPSVSRRRQVAFGVFLGLISFSIYFFLQTVERSIVKDVFPQLLYGSYFSTLYILIHITSLCYAVYLIMYYEYLSFVEIIRNRWYALVKMGYSTTEMILTKVLARILIVGVIYTIGFITTIILTAFLKFPFVIEYIPTLYIVGFLDLIIITVITMVISIIVKNTNISRYLIMISLFLLYVIKWVTGYSTVVANRDLMKNIWNVIGIRESPFLIVSIIIAGLMLVIGAIRAKNIAKYYNFPYYTGDIGLPKDVEIVTLGEDGGKFKPSKDYIVRRENKSMNLIFTIIISIVLGISIFINGMVLLISVTSGGTEVTMFGYIPYVFLSETMEPSIMYNDLAFFKKIDKGEEVKVSDIVLYSETKGENVEVARVKKIEGENITVDIDKYPENSDKKEKLNTIKSKIIYGKYDGKSRWLGALILFANSTFGRIILLIIPAILIFFYKEINKFFNDTFRNN